jgi:hypothetical protein
MQNHNENVCIMTRGGTHIKHVIKECCNNVKAYKMGNASPSFVFVKNVAKRNNMRRVSKNIPHYTRP